MTDEFIRIAELKEVREQKRELLARESELESPLLTDTSLMDTLYEWFNELQGLRDCPARVGSVHLRKKFIFIILFLYSPTTLAGGRVSNKIRSELSRVMACYPSYISHNIENIRFFFQRYRDFRSEVEELYAQIKQRLSQNGWLA